MPREIRPVLKWVIGLLLLLLTFVVQTTVSVWAIAGIRPVLIVAFVVSLSMQERESVALVFGAFGGLLWDYASGKVPGFNAIILTICCVAVTLVIMYYMNNTVVNALLLCGGVMLVQGLLDYVFGYLIWGYEGGGWMLLWRMLPTAVYTVAVTPAFYFPLRWLCGQLREAEEE